MNERIEAAIKAYQAAAKQYDQIMALEITLQNFKSFEDAVDARSVANRNKDVAGYALLATVLAEAE